MEKAKNVIIGTVYTIWWILIFFVMALMAAEVLCAFKMLFAWNFVAMFTYLVKGAICLGLGYGLIYGLVTWVMAR